MLVPNPTDLASLEQALSLFVTEPARGIAALGDGHLHETYLVQFAEETGRAPLVLQHVNTQVFTDIDAVMDNIGRVTSHARARLAQQGASDLARRVLTPRLDRHGRLYARDAQGRVYRLFDYIASSYALQQARDANDAFEAGRALGEFVQLMADLPAPPLHVTLPNFHAPEQRFLQLKAALAQDPLGRAAKVLAEWRVIEAREPLAYECVLWTRDPSLRQRVTHNDTKLNNILFDVDTRRSLCVVDLDTVMPGYLAFDFGDLVRTCVSAEAEDSLAPIAIRLDCFEALASGYLRELSSELSDLEHASLARGAQWIVLELAMRFLGDYVLGDRYFKVAHAEHNLDRARAQLRLLVELERYAEAMRDVLTRLR